MQARLSRADEILDPERAEAFKRKTYARTEARKAVFKAVTKNLLKSQDFVEWLNITIQSFGFWRFPNHELPAYDQGRRAAIHEMVERIIANGGEEAQAWYAKAAQDFTKWLQDERQ